MHTSAVSKTSAVILLSAMLWSCVLPEEENSSEPNEVQDTGDTQVEDTLLTPEPASAPFISVGGAVVPHDIDASQDATSLEDIPQSDEPPSEEPSRCDGVCDGPEDVCVHEDCVGCTTDEDCPERQGCRTGLWTAVCMRCGGTRRLYRDCDNDGAYNIEPIEMCFIPEFVDHEGCAISTRPTPPDSNDADPCCPNPSGLDGCHNSPSECPDSPCGVRTSDDNCGECGNVCPEGTACGSYYPNGCSPDCWWRFWGCLPICGDGLCLSGDPPVDYEEYWHCPEDCE